MPLLFALRVALWLLTAGLFVFCLIHCLIVLSSIVGWELVGLFFSGVNFVYCLSWFVFLPICVIGRLYVSFVDYMCHW